jgi:hypothetical protein
MAVLGYGRAGHAASKALASGFDDSSACGFSLLWRYGVYSNCPRVPNVGVASATLAAFDQLPNGFVLELPCKALTAHGRLPTLNSRAELAAVGVGPTNTENRAREPSRLMRVRSCRSVRKCLKAAYSRKAHYSNSMASRAHGQPLPAPCVLWQIAA